MPAPTNSNAVTTAPSGTGSSNTASASREPGLLSSTVSAVVAICSSMRTAALTRSTITCESWARMLSGRACGMTMCETRCQSSAALCAWPVPDSVAKQSSRMAGRGFMTSTP
ncbi:MAG: hypothetical protein U1E76_24650 [Planctomycetota bacterium]